jgi:hypothetical protein
MNHFFVVRFFKVTLKVTLKVLAAALVILLFFGCAYKLSNKVDTLPKNIKVLFIPVFKNSSAEPLVENYFTDALRSETLRSGYAKISNSEDHADAVLNGSIESVDVVSDESVSLPQADNYLPNNTVLSAQAKVTVRVVLVLKKKGSSEVLWSSAFVQSRIYTPPQLTLPTINSANSLYNLSIRQQTLAVLSKEMMQLAFDRLVDNF